MKNNKKKRKKKVILDMQNSGNTSSIPPPPPPPPLPSRQSLTQNCKCLHSYKEAKFPKKSAQDNIISAVRHITHNFYVDNPANLICLYHPISPVLQEGRCCGIVALAMASQFFHNVSVDDILDLAKHSNFTKEGEMFSAFNMANLAATLLDCDAFVIDDLYDNKETILSNICDGYPILIPYDADKNHFPCVNKGLTAHWAVISGLCFTVSNKSNLNMLKDKMINVFPELNIFTLDDGSYIKNLLNHSEKIFLFAHQGKSKHLAAWDLYDLLESNKSMYEVTKKYSPEELVLPLNDSLSELRNKAVILRKK